MPRRALGWLACAVGFMLLLPFVTGAAEPIQMSMAGFDGDESSHRWETNAFFSRMEKQTGIHFTFDQYTDFSAWQAAKGKMFEGGPLPDVLLKAELTTQELLRYTQSGQIIDLKPLLEENAPHLWALLTQNPEWMKAITLPGGKIGALPSLAPLPVQNAMWINQQWLDTLGLPMPTDRESLTETLRAFQQRDPNQNGKQDEIPLSFLGVWDLKFLSHAFGVAVNDYNVYVEDGQVRCWPMETSFLDLLGYLRGLYTEKLLDPNGFFAVDMFRTSTEEKAPAVYGVFFGPNPLTLTRYESSQEYVLMPPLAYGGKQIYRDLYGSVMRGVFAITSACEDPGALLRWVDILYTPEGAIQAMAGEEGVDYLLDEEGRWQWAGMEGGAPPSLQDMSVSDTGNMPWLFPQAFYNRFAEDGVVRINGELEKLQPFVVRPFPDIVLDEKQSERAAAWQAELGPYVDSAFARFVLGQWELTPDRIEAFSAGLRQRGAEDMAAFWQQVYDGFAPANQ